MLKLSALTFRKHCRRGMVGRYEQNVMGRKNIRAGRQKNGQEMLPSEQDRATAIRISEQFQLPALAMGLSLVIAWEIHWATPDYGELLTR